MLTDERYNFVKIYENSFRNNWELDAITDYGTTNTLTYGQLAERIAQLHILFKIWLQLFFWNNFNTKKF